MAIKNPVVRKIFDDLDEFHNFCRTEGHKFDQKFLYNSESKQWHAFQKYKNWIRAKNRNKGRR
tara:strand:- start:777 stop:965 length:189 start_codon:yes stop_codon:yes gene_type:complete